MSFLLDTNVCIAFLNGKDQSVRDQLLKRDPGEVYLCTVVKAELLYGARNSTYVDANLNRLGKFFEPFVSIPFDDEAASLYGIVRAHLRREGRPIGSNDLMIAATALATDLTLVTRNQDEFSRVSGLRLTSW